MCEGEGEAVLARMAKASWSHHSRAYLFQWNSAHVNKQLGWEGKVKVGGTPREWRLEVGGEGGGGGEVGKYTKRMKLGERGGGREVGEYTKRMKIGGGGGGRRVHQTLHT